MKRVFFFILLSVVVFPDPLAAQEEEPLIISGEYRNVPFTEFAESLLRDYGINIYYKDEWVENVFINARGDSLILSTVLESVLKPLSIYFIQQDKRQFFLTGSTEISNEMLAVQENIPEDVDSADRSIAEIYFGNFSYEKTVSRVTIGENKGVDMSSSCVLSGRISSAASGEPVVGATVFVEGTNNGTITDADGNYNLTVKPGTTFTINISCMGMNPEEYIVEMNSSGSLNIELREKLIDIQEVVVRSGMHDNVRGMQMGFQRIDMKDIKSIPVVMGERDILKIANMMPGVQTVGEGSAGFNVRGSSSDQNLFLLNEIPVLNTSHMFGFFSAFNPDMISNFNLYKSNFPAEYGGRLASVFEISTRTGNKKKFGARGAISPVTGSLLMETPIVRDKSSVILGARSTYSDWILNRIDDPDIQNSNASFYDLMAGIHILNDDHSSWQASAYYSFDRFSLASTNDYRYENIGASLIYHRSLNEKWSARFGAVYSEYINYHNSREQLSRAFEHQFNVKTQQLKAGFSGFPLTDHHIGFGTDATLYNIDQGSYDPLGFRSLLIPTDFGKENGLEYSIYAYDEYTLSGNMTLYAGLRYSLFNYLGRNTVYLYAENMPYELDNIIDTIAYASGKTIKHYAGPEYRLSLNYKFNSDFSMKFSYNRMRQYLFMLSNTVSISPIDRWKLVDNHISPPVSDQLSLGLYRNMNNAALETSVEIYYKNSRNIVEYKDGADLTSSPDFETLVLQGVQNSYGAEFMVKRNAGRLTGWISYTLSRSIINVDGGHLWDRINKGLSYPANYDKTHSLNFVGNLRISRRISLSSNIVYNTGRPITYPSGIIYIDGIQVINYNLRNENRIPDYFRMDAAINIEGNLVKKKLAHSSWSFAVSNLTGRKNAYSIYFKNVDGKIKGYKQSIYGVPIFTISLNIKLGNYAVE